MKLLVTGGCGFIGSAFVRLLLADGARALRAAGCDGLVNLDALTYAGNPANLDGLEEGAPYHFVHGDIADAPLLARLLAEHTVGAVVHFAAESHVDRSIDSPEPFVQTNTIGTLRLLDAARRHRRTLPAETAGRFRFVHVSTDEVFGSLAPDDPPFSETTPYAPNSPYAASKAASDLLARAYHHTYDLPVVTTNCSNNYGPRQFPEKLIPLMLLNGLEGRPLPVYGDGMNIRDWLYVDDHCRGVLAALQHGRPGETYCFGGCNETTNLQIVRTLCALLDELGPPALARPAARLITFVPDRPGHDRRYAIDCAKARRELGWAPQESFTSGIRRTVAWYLENGAWCRDITERRYRRERLGAAS